MIMPFPKEVKLPDEVISALERLLDTASVETRMKSQLDWEAVGRVTPRITPEVEVLPEAPAKAKHNRRGNKLKRKLALGALVVGGAAVTVLGVESAYDQQQQFYK